MPTPYEQWQNANSAVKSVPLVTDNSASQSSFQDPYNFHSNLDGYDTGNDLGSWFAKVFGGYDKQSEYQRRLDAENRDYERQMVASARAWDEFVNTHKYQWAVSDLKAAGLNPWLAVQSGLSGNQISSTAGQVSAYDAKSSKDSSGGNVAKKGADIISSVIKILVAAALLA